MSYTLKWDEARLSRVTDDAIEAGVRNGAALLRDEAVERTPEDTGALRESAGIDVKGNRATVYFGTDHAIAVHERLDLHHRNGQAKFLETALNSQADMIVDAIGIGIARVIDRG